MQKHFALLAILCGLLLFPALALSQTSVVGTNVQSISGTPLASGQWCINAQCFTVTAGAIAGGASVPNGTNGTVTVTDGAAYVYLAVPAVNVTGTIFNWNNFIQPASTTSNGQGVPYLACQFGAQYRQNNVQAPYNQWACININGVPTWNNSNPTPVPPSAPDILAHNANIQNQLQLNGQPGSSGNCPISGGPNAPTAWGACAGGGSPGGSSGSAQYNNNGSFAGLSGTGLEKLNGSSAPTIATPGTDYVVPSGIFPSAPGSGYAAVSTQSGTSNYTAQAVAVLTNANAFTNAGVFTNTQMNQFQTYSVNGLNFTTLFQATWPSLGYATEVGSFGLVVPSSSTVFQSDTIGVYTTNASTTTNAVSGMFVAHAEATGASVWGINPVVVDNGYGSGSSGFRAAEEDDCNVSNTTNGACHDINGLLGGANLTNYPALQILSTNGTWSSDINLGDASSSLAMQIGAVAHAASNNSMPIQFNTYDSTDTLQTIKMYAVPSTTGNPPTITVNGGMEMDSNSSLPAFKAVNAFTTPYPTPAILAVGAASFTGWKDATPSEGFEWGYNVPGNAAGNNVLLSVYGGSAWLKALTINSSTGSLDAAGGFSANGSAGVSKTCTTYPTVIGGIVTSC